MDKVTTILISNLIISFVIIYNPAFAQMYQQRISDPCPAGYFLSTGTGRCEIKDTLSRLNENSQRQTEGEVASLGRYVTYRNVNNNGFGFAMDIPEGTKIDKSIIPGKLPETHFTVDNPTAKLHAVISIGLVTTTEGRNPAEQVFNYESNFLQNEQGCRLGDKHITTISGLPAVTSRFVCTANSVGIVGIFHFVPFGIYPLGYLIVSKAYMQPYGSIPTQEFISLTEKMINSFDVVL
jgi:hypothetical protein